MIFVIKLIVLVTFFDDSVINQKYKYLWNWYLVVFCVVFTVNEFLFYFQVKKHLNKPVHNTKKYSFFSLHHTNPNAVN